MWKHMDKANKKKASMHRKRNLTEVCEISNIQYQCFSTLTNSRWVDFNSLKFSEWKSTHLKDVKAEKHCTICFTESQGFLRFVLLVFFPVLEKFIHIGSLQFITISLVNIQNYNGAERKDLYILYWKS